MSRSSAARTVLLLAIAAGFAWGLWPREGPLSQEPVDAPYIPEHALAEWHGDTVRSVESRIDVMGTRFVVETAAPDESTARAALLAAWTEIRRLEDEMSTWIPASVLSRVNREAARGPVPVGPDTFDCLRRAKDYWRISSGAFDPTVGPLLALWRPLSHRERVPSVAEIRAARDLVDYGRVRLDPEKRTVFFEIPGAALDVGGIAKGYAADRAVRVALEAGATACRVNAGGDQTALGAPVWAPYGFEVTIRDPERGQADSLEGLVLRIRDRAVATSGNYERYAEIAGERYSHIVDPRTGRPVPNAVAQVTVLASTGTEADALATALVVLGPEDGLKLAASIPEAEAMFFVHDGDGWRTPATSGFPEREE